MGLPKLPQLPGLGNSSVLQGKTTPQAQVAADANEATGGVYTDTQDVGNFFHALAEKATWERVAEVLCGVLFVYIGMKGLITPAGQSVKSQTLSKTAKRIVETGAMV
jgi:hypothetical protein